MPSLLSHQYFLGDLLKKVLVYYGVYRPSIIYKSIFDLIFFTYDNNNLKKINGLWNVLSIFEYKIDYFIFALI